MTTEFLQHLAGLVDSDGCYTLKQRHGADVRIGQGEKKLDLLEHVMQKTGFGTIGTNGQKKREFNQENFQWFCCGDDAVKIAQQILPYTVEKKRLAEVIAGYECGRTQDTPVTVMELDKTGAVVTTTQFTSSSKAAAYLGFSGPTNITTWSKSGRAVMSKTLKEYVKIPRDTETPLRIKANHERQLKLWEQVQPLRPGISGFTFPLRFSGEVEDKVPNSMSEPYAAGFAEGDGCFCIETYNGIQLRIRVSVGQKDSYMPLQFLRYFKTGVIYHGSKDFKRPDKTTILCHKYEWTVFGQEAIDYMTRIRPFIVSAAVQEQIDIIVNNEISFATQKMLLKYKGCTFKKVDNPMVEKQDRAKKQKV